MATGGVSDIEYGTEEMLDYLCSVCEEKNKRTEAKKFCSDCNDYYCYVCVKVHSNIPALKDHNILDTAQIQHGTSVKLLALPTERCRIHKHKAVDMYCKNHDVVACSACMLVEHSVCKDKFYVPEFTKNRNKVPNTTDIADQLDTIANHLSALQKAIIAKKEKLKSSKENSLKEIQKFRKEINQYLDELEESIVIELDFRFQALQDKLDSELKDIQASTSEVKASQDGLKSSGDNIAQRFVSVKTAQAVAAHAKMKTDTSRSRLSSAEISFAANQNLKDLLSDIPVLGNITITDEPLPQAPRRYTKQQVGISRANQKTDERKSGSSLLKIKGSKKYNVKVKSDKETCDIYGACTLDDGTIILSDYANTKLKRLDPNYFFVRDCCIVPEFPLQVCAISNTEVAVGCENRELIQFVAVGMKMKKTRQINTDFSCYGLAYADGSLFVSDDKYVYTLSRHKWQRLAVLHDLGQSRLAVSSDNLKIYVSSYDKGLIIVDRKGSFIGGFNSAELGGADDVCLHNSGNVLVCSVKLKNIFQFSPDGKLIGEILKTDKSCQAICYDKNNSVLIVGFYKSDKIGVYDITQ